MRLKRRIIFLSLALALIMAIGTAGFSLIEGRPVFEAFYMTLTTLTSIGYGELWPFSREARVFNVGLIVVGIITAFALLGTLTQAMLESELAERFGGGRMERALRKLNDHYVVCGLGRVGRSVVRQFERSGVPFVTIESDSNRVRWALERDVLVVVGDATHEQTLRQAHVERARALVAAVGGDAENMYITLAARELNPKLQIVTRATDEEAERSLRRAGADLVISPYTYTGYRIAQALLRPHVLDFMDAVSGTVMGEALHLLVEEIRVARGSALVGQTLEQSGIRLKLGVMILAVKKTDGQMKFNPPSDAFIDAGDFLIAMGESEDLKKLEALAGG